ncbi:MAG: hypothetical protein IRY94_03370 [Rhodospirillaceae bacterium]|nr:hypothetical protein [Rhodospirillaceae bacterium]
MAAARDHGGAMIRGHPGRLAGVVPLGLAVDAQGELQLLDEAGNPVGAPVLAAVRPSGAEGLARVKFRLDSTLAPGRYRGRLVVHGDPHVVMFDVEALPRLRAEPPMLRLRAPAGSTASATLTLFNRGNVAVEVPERAVVGVFDDEGMENAIARAYRSESDDGLEILKRFVEGLRAGYGNMLNLQVTEGAGPLAPGTARTLRVSLPVPERLRARHTYSGFWSLANLNYTVEITVAGEAQEGGTQSR